MPNQPRRGSRSVAFVACLVVVACQRELPVVVDEPTTPAVPSVSKSLSRTRPEFELREPADFYRIDLARTAGVVRLDAITRVTTQLRPLPSLSPEYLLVAFRGDKAVAATPVRFPATAHDIDFDAQSGGHREFAVTDTRVSASIAADAAIDRIELVDSSNQTLVRIASAALPKAASGGGSGGGALSGPEELRARFPSIRFLRANEDSGLADDVLSKGHVIDLTPQHVYAFDQVLSALAPAVRASIQTLAVVDFPSDAINKATGNPLRGRTIGPQIAISSKVTLADDLMDTIAHEAAHSLDHSTRVAAGAQDNTKEGFRAEWVTYAEHLIEEHHLLLGIDDAWKKLHESGIDHQLTTAYTPTVDEANWQAALKGGFFSAYGGASAAEDFAEYVRDRTVGTRDFDPCMQFDGASGEQLDLAIPYAKLVLLLGIGAITEASFTECVGNTYSVIPDEPGFSFQGYARRLDEDVSVQFADDKMPPDYVVHAAGLGYRMNINLRRGDVNDSPIGLHRLASISLANVGDIAGADFVSLLGQKASDARASSQGIVLLVEATEHSAQGVMFGLGLQDARGEVTDRFPLVSFRVDQP